MMNLFKLRERKQHIIIYYLLTSLLFDGVQLFIKLGTVLSSLMQQIFNNNVYLLEYIQGSK